MDTNTTPVDFESLADIISVGKCVLFLGPEATVNYSDEDRLNNFYNQLCSTNPSSIYSYNKEDGLFVFNNPSAIWGIQMKIKRFYNNDYPLPIPILTKLAQIPFHFIISLSPDTYLQKVMQNRGFNFKQDFYDIKNEHTPAPDLPTPKTPPLIYHLLGISSDILGNASDIDSLIVSHGHMYNYIRSFLGGTKLPQNIKTAINFDNAKSLIFLGVNFDKWYFQLILNMLGVDTTSYDCFASIQSGATSLQTIWEKHFHINFVPDKIDEFVDNLYNVFKQRNELRTVASQPALVRKYRIDKFKNFFDAAFNDMELKNFCQTYFYDVYNDFGDGQDKNAHISILMDYIIKQNQYEPALKAMQEENQPQFVNNQPYYDEQ